MSQDVTERYELIKSYEAGIISLSELKEKLSLSRQQVYRIIKSYHTKGLLGLYHGNRNKPSHHSYNPIKKSEIMRLIRDKYYDCGASYASELLEEYEGIKINRETLRLWMKQEQLLINQRKRRPYRKHRERKTAFGEMLQIDGCFDYWFGRDNPKACLINLIDDATSYNLCYFDSQETIRAATIVLWKWIKKFGIPQSIYADRRNAYINYDLTASMFLNSLRQNICEILQLARSLYRLPII